MRRRRRPNGPLVDVTFPGVPRVFPTRYDQPSALQPSGDPEGWRDNPLDDQNTVYGLTVAQGQDLDVFVTERERGLVRQLRIEPTSDGRLTYSEKRTLLFDTVFELQDAEGATYAWTPCREAASEEPQSEGLVYDTRNDILYVAFETIGLYKVPVNARTPRLARVDVSTLIDPLISFGRSYHATPDEDEFACAYGVEGSAQPGDVVAPGSDIHAGRFLEPDLEGLSIIDYTPGHTLLLASSQGDSSFHFYDISQGTTGHRGSFLVDGVEETDGVHYVRGPVGRRYPLGLLVVQNGHAPEPESTGPINGYALDGATQFKYVDFRDALTCLRR
jgi:3-phytase